jgi:hypothetical protein
VGDKRLVLQQGLRVLALQPRAAAQGSRRRGRRSCKITAVVQRVLDRFWSLPLAQKVLVALLAVILLFLATFLISTALFRSMGSGSERGSTLSEQSAAPKGEPDVDVAVTISSARWEGQKAVVEGTWKGEVSSVRCDLLEAGAAPTRWWDRSVGTQIDWSGRTFTQEFVAARGSEDWEPLDPLASYDVECWGLFAGEVMTSASAHVEGKNPTG